MPITPASGRGCRRLPLLILLLAALTLPGCGRAPAAVAGQVGRPALPGPLDLTTPGAAVRTYLGYTSFAYRVADSDVASRAATEDEGVRVDSYVELNRQKGQGIEQRLVRFALRSETAEGTRAVVAASEEWRYRYFSLTSLAYTSPAYAVSYDTTYTLVKERRGWLVDKVAAKALTPVR